MQEAFDAVCVTTDFEVAGDVARRVGEPLERLLARRHSVSYSASDDKIPLPWDAKRQQ